MDISKEQISKLYCAERMTMSEIGKIFGISRKSVKKILEKYDIESRKTRASCDIPDKDELIKLYTEQMLTLNQIGKLYGVGRKTVNSWFNTHNITKISNMERKYYGLRKIPLSQKQKEFIIGTMLGDGSIASSGKFKRLSLGHSIKQVKYLLWKKDIMGNLINNVYRQTQTTRNSTILHCCTIGHQDFNFFYKLFYKNNKKIIRDELAHYITPFSMAVWYMDDGSAKKYCMKISTEGFTKKENEILQHIVNANFKIKCKVCEYNNRGKKYYYLSFNKKNSILLCNLIDEHVIDSMRYKIPFPNDYTLSA